MSGGDFRSAKKDWERFLVVAVVAIWAAVRFLQIDHLGWGTGYDVNLYQQYAQQWGSGAGAYVDFQPEYPPGALPVFLLPLLFGGAANYARAFAGEMAFFDLLSLVLVFKCGGLRAKENRWRPLCMALLYTFTTAALFPVLYSRFDLVPGSLVLAALYCLQTRRSRAAGLLLGMAGAVKLWPFALVPIWLAWELRRGSVRKALVSGLAIGVGAVLIALPVLPRAGWHVLTFLQYHAARGIQIETTWATVALLLGRLGVASVHPEHNFGAFHVGGRLSATFAALSMPLTVVFALVPQIMAIVWLRRKASAAGSARVLDYAVFGTVAGFMIAGKVLSPQFMLWIAPLLPLAVEGPIGAVSALALTALTTVVYPYLSPALEQRAEGHGWALVSVGSRNLLLLGWYGVALYRVQGGRAQAMPGASVDAPDGARKPIAAAPLGR